MFRIILNIETKKQYWHIAGSLAWPTDTAPGFGLIIGVVKEENLEPTFFCLEEIEEIRPRKLLMECANIREKWGFWEDAGLLRLWMGDYNRFGGLVGDVNEELKKKYGNGENGLSLTIYSDLKDSNAAETFLNQVRDCLAPESKNLLLGDCIKLRNYILNLPKDITMKKAVEKFPALLALGYVVDGLSQIKSWLVRPTSQRTRPTVQDEYENYLTHEARQQEEFYGVEDDYDYGELEPVYGEMKNTIPGED